MTSDPSSASPTAFDEANAWLIRIHENPQSTDLRAAFEAWLRNAPENEQAWADLCLLWRAAGKAEPYYRSLDVPARRTTRLSAFSVPRIATGLTVASLAVLSLWFAIPSLGIRLTADHVTAAAETRVVSLADGSTVELAPDSALRIEFRDGSRQVALLRGEAFFDVTRDTDRKFRVLAGNTEVEVLGTAFDVHLTGAATEVSVARGSVSTRDQTAAGSGTRNILAPGEAVSIDRQTGVATRTLVAADHVGSWRHGRLVVRNATIESVVDILRHYDHAWITLADPSLGQQKVTGIYDLRSPALALGALVDPFGGKVRTLGNAVRVVSRF